MDREQFKPLIIYQNHDRESENDERHSQFCAR